MTGPVSLWSLILCVAASARTSAATSLPLQIGETPARAVQVSWPDTGSSFVLEATDQLSPSPAWQRVPQPATRSGGNVFTILPSAASSRFYRLRLPLVTVSETSPAAGEVGVYVQRESIVRFTAPLSANTLLSVTNFYAESAGRKLLTRTELASDRKSATLFYLEPLPGSSRVRITFDGTGLVDELDRPIDADGDDIAGGVRRLSFDTLALTPVFGTAIIGHVFAAQPDDGNGPNPRNHPLEGVVISVDGVDQDLRTVTDVNGAFALEPVPAGRFFVKIDGRTAIESSYPSGAYYPYVGKAWDAVAGVKTNLAGGTGEIFLPLINSDTLQEASATSDTSVGFPASVATTNSTLSSLSVTVPANSLFSDDGKRGGRVGIAPVPSDRLPGPLPAGLELPLVITVQTDGAGNFDRPAPVCAPNDPSIVAGAPLPPGARSTLLSFDHKKGIWVGVGSMTVTPDGKFLCTDQGVGIRQPGWHGFGPPSWFPPELGGGDPSGNEGSAGNSGSAGGNPTSGGASGSSNPGNGSPGAGDPGGSGPGASGSEGNGSNGDSKPPEKPPCKDADYSECLRRVEAREQECFAKRQLWYRQVRAGCERLKRQLGANHPEVKECEFEVGEGHKAKSEECRNLQLQGDQECQGCYLGGGPPSPGGNTAAVNSLRNVSLAGALRSLVEQIGALQDEALALLLPYYSARQPIPEAVGATADALLAQADALAGGNAETFLEHQALAKERSMQSQFDGFETEIGNAPTHPVLYRATIERASGPFSVRGQTAQLGNYQIFVPADGRLASIEFYDPLTGRYGSVFPNLRPEAPYRLPRFYLFPLGPDAADGDADGLPDVAEKVVGTNPQNRDTDGDGVPDGIELGQGGNPLDGLAAQVGIMASVETPGNAIDVAVDNDLAVIADAEAGRSHFQCG